MNGRHLITAFFDNHSDAQHAIERLVAAGISRGEIDIIEGTNAAASGTPASSSSTSDTSSSYETSGFWASLSKLFMPEEDRYTYAEGLQRGGYVVSLHADDAKYDAAVDILDDEGTVNIDERAETWRSEGWHGPQGSPDTAANRLGGKAGVSEVSAQQMGRASQTLSATEEVIPVAEEHLRVGKRETETGRMRVRSYVVETPVHEEVDLRQEHIDVERRPVDRPASVESAFRDRTLEATESAEEAVVSKDARVVEEVALRKEADTRRETVSDSVRKTKVEVEDERGERRTGATKTSRPDRRT